MILMSKRILAAACAAATALALSACTSTASSGDSSSKDGSLTVMASFYPLKYLAEKVGGEHVSVTSLTPDGAEPHDLELSPKMVDSLSSADAVIYLAGFQSAVDEAIEQQAPKTVIDVSSAAELIEAGTDANHPSEDEDEATDEAQSGKTEAHDHDHEGHDHEGHNHDHEGHDHEGHDHHHDMSADPHFWLDPTRMAKAATLVGDKLAEADSAHADVYKANAKALAEELNTLSDTLVTKTSSCKVKTFVTAHTAFGYLADRTGLTQVGISGLDPESSPSPARLAEIAQIAKEQGVTTIFTEALIDPKVAQTLADDLGITTAVLDPIESQTDASKDYAATMNSNIDALTKALDCQ